MFILFATGFTHLVSPQAIGKCTKFLSLFLALTYFDFLLISKFVYILFLFIYGKPLNSTTSHLTMLEISLERLASCVISQYPPPLTSVAKLEDIISPKCMYSTAWLREAVYWFGVFTPVFLQWEIISITKYSDWPSYRFESTSSTVKVVTILYLHIFKYPYFLHL